MNISDLRQRAQGGSAVAQTILGTCYLEGIDVEVDHEEAFRLLSAAADQGAPRGKMNLARMYAEGLGTAKNLEEATQLYEEAAEAGEFLAQVELGRRKFLRTNGMTAEHTIRFCSSVMNCAKTRQEAVAA